MKKLRIDASVGDVPMGTLIYSSSDAMKTSRGGNYYLEDMLSFVPDHGIFPALILPSGVGTFVRILTPTGIHMISRYSLVSYVRTS